MTVLDVCCGGKQFWFNCDDERVLFIDNRTVETILCDGRKFCVTPDMIADFRDLPFLDASFPLVVFDPPLSSWDFDYMTRLVVAAHDECIRIGVGAHTRDYFAISMHPREREGRMNERHPTLEEAITNARRELGTIPGNGTT